MALRSGKTFFFFFFFFISIFSFLFLFHFLSFFVSQSSLLLHGSGGGGGVVLSSGLLDDVGGPSSFMATALLIFGRLLCPVSHTDFGRDLLLDWRYSPQGLQRRSPARFRLQATVSWVPQLAHVRAGFAVEPPSGVCPSACLL